MIRATLAGLALALVCASAALADVPPGPDPPPGAHGKPTIVGMSFTLPAVDAATGREIPGLYFACRAPARWNGKPNRYGRSTCTLHARAWAPEPLRACARAVREGFYTLALFGQCLADYADSRASP